MTIAIMQPYFLPYLGYFQLVNAVDKFVLYDNIQYTKKGWFNRNRIIINGKEEMFSLPIKKDSDYLNVAERRLADDYLQQNEKTLRKIRQSYVKAENFTVVMSLLEKLFLHESENLYEFIFYSLQQVCAYIGLKDNLVKASTIGIDHNLKAEEKVLAICTALEAAIYINPIGGQELYNKEKFAANNIDLKFLKADLKPYKDSGAVFIPGLSMIDLLMHVEKPKLKEMINFDFSLI